MEVDIIFCLLSMSIFIFISIFFLKKYYYNITINDYGELLFLLFIKIID